jgi:acyl carrier protein
MPDNLEMELKELIADVSGKEVGEIKSEANLWEDLGIDSIKAIEITVAIEKKYKIRVKDEEVAQITTVAKAIEVVRESIKRKKNG